MDIPDTLPADHYAVYTLIDPTDHLVYYVGQTRNPKGRLGAHLAARHHQGAKGEWLRRLKHQGQQPLMQILEIVIGEEAALAREQGWIRHFLEKQMPLLNAQAEPIPKVQAIMPIRQETILLFGYPVIVVLLSDEQTAASVRSLFSMLKIARHAQIRRIFDDPILSKHLLRVIIQTPGGPQVSDFLTDWAISLWLSGLQATRLLEEKQALALRVKQEAAAAMKRAFTRRE